MEIKIPREHPRLLIAEDDLRLQKALVREFSDLDYEVVAISSLAEFSRLSKSPQFDFGIIDLRLGSDSGFALIDLLKGHSSQCRFVVLTGYGSIPTAVEAIKRGAVQYLTKPSRTEDIEKALWGEDAHAIEELEGSVTTLAQNERDFIDAVLLQCEGNITQAAKRLGIHRQSLQRKLRKLS